MVNVGSWSPRLVPFAGNSTSILLGSLFLSHPSAVQPQPVDWTCQVHSQGHHVSPSPLLPSCPRSPSSLPVIDYRGPLPNWSVCFQPCPVTLLYIWPSVGFPSHHKASFLWGPIRLHKTRPNCRLCEPSTSLLALSAVATVASLLFLETHQACSCLRAFALALPSGVCMACSLSSLSPLRWHLIRDVLLFQTSPSRSCTLIFFIKPINWHLFCCHLAWMAL